MVTRRNSMMKAFKLKRNLIRLPSFYQPPENKPQIDSTISFSFTSCSPFSSSISMAGKGKSKRRTGLRKRPYSRDCESLTSPDNRKGGGKGSSNSQQKDKQPSVIIISSSNQENPIELTAENQMLETPLNVKDVTNQFSALNSNMEKVIIAFGVLSQAWLSNSHQNTLYGTPTSDNIHTSTTFTTPNLTSNIERMAETEAILQKFMNSGSDQRRLYTGPDDVTLEKAKRLVKKLFTPPETAPEDSFWAPEWLTAMFGPRNVFALNCTEAAVASYIFKTANIDNSDMTELFIKPLSDKTFGNRKNMMCLKPRGLVEQEILNLLVCKLTHDERLNHPYPSDWFLPTHFAQFALSWTAPPALQKQNYQEDYMGKLDFITKIFVPVNDHNMHWYLLVVDLLRKELVFLDSFPTPDRMDIRVFQIKILAVHLQLLFSDPSWYEYEASERPKISEFKIVLPDGVGLQKDDSHDCGIWVAQWMENKGRNGYKIEVQPDARLKLALDLALHPSNTAKNDLIKKSMAYINKCKYPGNQKE